MVDKVAPYKYLSGGVSFIPRIPRNVVSGLPFFHPHKVKLKRDRMVKSYVQSCESWPERNLGAPWVTTMEFAANFQESLHRFGKGLNLYGLA